MDSVSYKIVIVSLVAFILLIVIAVMWLAYRQGKRSLSTTKELGSKEKLVKVMKKHAESQDRLISLLKSRSL